MYNYHFDSIIHNLDFQNKINQIDKTNSYKFGDEVKVLILTDRLIGCADGLKECLKCYPDITVHLIYNAIESTNIPIIPDFIVFVGYLTNKRKYQICDYAKKINISAVSILYARIDDCSLFEKFQYKLDECFDRDLPVSQFVNFLRDIYKNEKTLAARMKNEKINTAYLSLKKMPQFYLNILSLIYFHTHSMAATASVLEIPIKKLYVYKSEGIKILKQMVDKSFFVNDKELLMLALEKYELEALITEVKYLEVFFKKADIELSYNKLMAYIKKRWVKIYMHKIKYLYYIMYEKIRGHFEIQDL